MRLLDRLHDETRLLQAEAEAGAQSLLTHPTPESYRTFLSRTFGFVAPVERALADLSGLDRFIDVRRLRKHVLLQHDLESLGFGVQEIYSLPQCMSVPWFDQHHEALGWAYIIEHSTLTHASLFRQLATALPGEVAFGASYLKCYFGCIGEMWRSFGEGLQASVEEPHHANRIVDAARAGYRHYRRWRSTQDGTALSGEHAVIAS